MESIFFFVTSPVSLKGASLLTYASEFFSVNRLSYVNVIVILFISTFVIDI